MIFANSIINNLKIFGSIFKCFLYNDFSITELTKEQFLILIFSVITKAQRMFNTRDFVTLDDFYFHFSYQSLSVYLSILFLSEFILNDSFFIIIWNSWEQKFADRGSLTCNVHCWGIAMLFEKPIFKRSFTFDVHQKKVLERD